MKTWSRQLRKFVEVVPLTPERFAELRRTAPRPVPVKKVPALPRPKRVPRNAKCPCLSGAKFKRCHGFADADYGKAA